MMLISLKCTGHCKYKSGVLYIAWFSGYNQFTCLHDLGQAGNQNHYASLLEEIVPLALQHYLYQMKVAVIRKICSANIDIKLSDGLICVMMNYKIFSCKSVQLAD